MIKQCVYDFGTANRLRVRVADDACFIGEARSGWSGEWVTIGLLPSEVLELIVHLEAAVNELKARGNLRGGQTQDEAGGKSFPSLSQEYHDRRRWGFAYCHDCKVTYLDDVPNYGSLFCPRCWESTLMRGWVVGEAGAAGEEG